MKLWKVSERDRRPEGYNLKDDSGLMRDPTSITTLRVPVFKPMELMVEASPRRVFANAHTYHINSISVNSDQETYMSADDLRINLWHLEITDQSFSILFDTLIGEWGGRTRITLCCCMYYACSCLFVAKHRFLSYCCFIF